MKQSDVLKLAKISVFRKLPVEVLEKLVNLREVLIVMNEWAVASYGVPFFNEAKEVYDPSAYNQRFRLTGGGVDFNKKVGFPFFCVTTWLEFEPFDVPERSAKFGLSKRLKEPLLDPGAAEKLPE